MAKTYQVYDTESGRVVSIIKRVADGVKLTAATLTSGSAGVTVAATDDLWPGMLLIGKGIPVGTTVLSVDTATAFTMSANATADGSSLFIVSLSYIPYKADGTLDTREVHLEHYRDMFSDTTDTYSVVDNIMSGTLSPPGVVMYPESATFTRPPSQPDGPACIIPGDLVVSISDDKTHTVPREQVQKCSFVHFILEDGTLLPVLRLPAYDIVPVS